MKGYISILVTLVLLMVTGGIATTMLLVSTDGIQSGEALRLGEQALFFSESCLEEGLLRIVRNAEYAGGNFSVPEGQCEVEVVKVGETYAVRATGVNARFERSLVAEAALGAQKLEVSSWKEE